MMKMPKSVGNESAFKGSQAGYINLGFGSTNMAFQVASLGKVY